ncbi:hypothetical protein [Paraburkholderia sediminicola]|uniref:hypothetical protein n=1 Tax=Paraburkholderia sediminicola TaxID=458836 RepID=UPI0038B9BFC0
MSNPNFLVIRIHPDSPVDGANTSNNKTFADNTDVSSIPIASNPPTTLTLTLNQTIPKFVAPDTLITFYFAYGPGSADSNATSVKINPTWTGSDPSFQFDLKVKGKVTSSPTVKFDHSDGIAVGMTMIPGSGVPANTTVIAVTDGTSITLSNNVSLANNATVTFQSNLNSGIIQHVEPVATGDTIERLFKCSVKPSKPGRSPIRKASTRRVRLSAISLRFRSRAGSQRWVSPTWRASRLRYAGRACGPSGSLKP